MKADREKRLERYFLNAEPFLWGIWRREKVNKAAAYGWLRPEAKKAWPALHDFFGFSDRTSYEDVARLLLRTPGIERLARDLVIPTVRELPVGAIVDDLRFLWMAGRRPDSSFLDKRGLKPDEGWPFLSAVSYPFNKQEKYVAGWTQFAGVWFEEIEHLDD